MNQLCPKCGKRVTKSQPHHFEEGKRVHNECPKKPNTTALPLIPGKEPKDPLCDDCSRWKKCKGSRIEHKTEIVHSGEAEWDEEYTTCGYFKPSAEFKRREEEENVWVEEEMQKVFKEELKDDEDSATFYDD